MFVLARRLYDWVLSWAETRYGTPALGVLSFAEASFFPIPPDVLLIALCIGKRERSMYYATVCAIASLFGGMFGYLIGWAFWEATDQIFYTYVFSEASFAKVQDYYMEYDFWIVFIAAFTPIPYKIITIAGGVCGIFFPMFLLASAVGRAARFYLVAGLIYHYGAPIRTFVEKRFNTLTVVFVILLVGGFAALNYMGNHKEDEVPAAAPPTVSQEEAANPGGNPDTAPSP